MGSSASELLAAHRRPPPFFLGGGLVSFGFSGSRFPVLPSVLASLMLAISKRCLWGTTGVCFPVQRRITSSGTEETPLTCKSKGALDTLRKTSRNYRGTLVARTRFLGLISELQPWCRTSRRSRFGTRLVLHLVATRSESLVGRYWSESGQKRSGS